MPYLCWRPAYPKYNWSPLPTCPISEGSPSIRNIPPPSVGSYVAVAQPVGPSRFARSNMGVWGICFARMWTWGHFCPIPQPLYKYHYDKMWWGRPSCNLTHERLRTQHHIRCSVGEGLEVWWCILGIWHSSIPVCQDPFRLPWMALPRATQPSSIHDGYGECPYRRVPWMQLWAPPPLPCEPSTSGSQYGRPSGVLHGTLTGTWHRRIGLLQGAW